MAELYTTRLGGSHFIHSRSLLFEGNASLKCVYSGLMLLSTVFQSYHDDVWLVQGAQCGLGDSHFYTYNSGFPCAFICLSFMLMAVDFSYSVQVFILYYIVIDLEAGQYFVGRVQDLDYMHCYFVHFTEDGFGFNLGIDSTKYFLLS